jgi:glycolate oxidase FAD binding subunit
METRDPAASWQAWNTAFRPRGLAMRVHVMPSLVGEAVSVLDRRFAGASALLSATVSAGVIRIVLGGDSELRAASLIEVARDVATRRDGSLLIEAAPATAKREIDVFGPLRSDFPTMKRLKDEFDPTRVLSPGRFVGRL